MLRIGIFLCLTAFALTLNAPAHAARPSTEPSRESIYSRAEAKLIRRIQTSLREMGLYKGTIDGILGPATVQAIKSYEKTTGRKVTGRATRELATQLETDSKVGKLMHRLEEARNTEQEAARQALLANPETRALIEQSIIDERADPTRDASSCFEAPNARCLLLEAAESAKAIHKDEMRHWALGELLVAQAKAGLAAEAMLSVRRIHDPRLVMSALRDIAKAQAAAGRNDAAMDAVDIIPDALKQVEAYVAIAEIQAIRGDKAGALKTAQHLLPYLAQLDLPRRVAFHARMAVILFEAGHPDDSRRHLIQAEELARMIHSHDVFEAALRDVANAQAKTGMTVRALTLLEEVTNGSDAIPVLMAAATVQANAGDASEALITADSIEAVRYRAVVLAAIAEAQSDTPDDARATLATAEEAATKIKFPYAKAYAYSRIALTWSQLGSRHGNDQESYANAERTAAKISDDKLRAHVLWTIAATRTRAGDAAGASTTEALAVDATDAMKSSLSRVWMFGDIALAHAKRAESGPSWNAFDKALREAEAMTNAWGRARALAKVADTLTELSDLLR